jgi:hypothetical protein
MIIPRSFSEGAFLQLLTNMIVMEDLPQNFVDAPSFRTLVGFLRPGTAIPHRTKQSELIEKYYSEEVLALKRKLAGVKSCISIGADVWTSPNQLPFMGITGHWITDDWKLSSALIGFEYVEGEHSGSHLADFIINVLDRYEIADRLLAVTTDNASNNDTLVKTLEDRLGPGADRDPQLKSVFQSSWCHVRCFAHVINLVCKTLMGGLYGSVDLK